VPLFGFTGPDNAGPGWYTDTYHHWQIGYFSKEVGFSKGFLRLWDLKGMEYFWGIGHPLTLALIFLVTGTDSLLVPRLLSVFGGAAVAGLLAVLGRRWFNARTAWAIGLWVALQPVAIFSDQSGMQEPLGLMLLVLGIYTWPKQPLLSGLFWGIAGTVRAEFWLFSLGLVAVAWLRGRKLDEKMLVGFSYLIVTGIHVKILLDKTGNMIYPIWWNFLANAKGDWLPPAPNTPITDTIALGLKGVFVLLVILGLLILWRKPKGYLLWSLGLFNLGFLAFMGGFSAYVYYYRLPRFYVDRLWSFPYSMLGIVFIVVVFYWLPKTWRFLNKIIDLAWAPLLTVIIGVSLVAWPFILDYFEKNSIWEREVEYGNLVGSAYQGGRVLIPQDRPAMTYNLVHFQGIEAKNIGGQMFDRFYYLDTETPFEDWGKYRESVIEWLKEENVKLLVLDGQAVHRNYGKLVEVESDLFELKVENPPHLWVYGVRL
jgi:hypothetical protein